MVKIHITYPNGNEDLVTLRDGTFTPAYKAYSNADFYSGECFAPVYLNQVDSYIKGSPFATEG